MLRTERTLTQPPGHEPWGIILAGGEGIRLRPLTRAITGDERPKQFCPILNRETLLEWTRRRVALVVPRERTLLVITRAHERFYAPLLAGVPSSCMVVQPENRGTAPAILYALLRLAEIRPLDAVAVFPSDHFVSDFKSRLHRARVFLRARLDEYVATRHRSVSAQRHHRGMPFENSPQELWSPHSSWHITETGYRVRPHGLEEIALTLPSPARG